MATVSQKTLEINHQYEHQEKAFAKSTGISSAAMAKLGKNENV